jgi:RNA binding exosome subunit
MNNNKIKSLRTELQSINKITDVLQNTITQIPKEKSNNAKTEQHTRIDLNRLLTYHKDGRCTNAYKLITSKPILLAAY